MADVWIQFAHRLPCHPRAPDSIAGDIDVIGVAKHLAVDLQVGAVLALLAPQGEFARHAVLRLQVLLPTLAWLDDMGIAIENRKALPQCCHEMAPSDAALLR